MVVVPVQREEWIKNVWKCHCLYSMKYGLPCCHELKAALITKSSLYEQIEPIYLL